MIRSRLALAAVLTLTLAQTSPVELTLAAQSPSTVDPSYLNLLRWRSIGPSRGGRVVAVAGDPVNKFTFYQGTTGGGVWKTDDGGLNWANVSDGFFATGSVGRHRRGAVEPERRLRRHGRGVLPGQRVARRRRLQVDRRRQDLDARSDSRPRGRSAACRCTRPIPTSPTSRRSAMPGARIPTAASTARATADGPGRSVLFQSENAGAIDLVLDPGNPNVLYASTLELRRYPWGFRSAGPGTALFKSTDGGDTWTDLSSKPGLPKGDKGRIGIALAPSRPNRVWAHHRRRRRRQGHLPFRRRRRDLDPSHRQRRPHAAALVLPPHRRRPEEPRRAVGAQRRPVEVDRRRHDVPGSDGAARRQPRPCGSTRRIRSG